MNAFFHCIRHYFDCSGRECRRVYWTYIVVTHLVLIVLLIPVLTVMTTGWQDVLSHEENVDEISEALYDISEDQSKENVKEVVQSRLAPVIYHGFSRYFEEHEQAAHLMKIFLILTAFWVFLNVVPTMTATARRLRDVGRSRWWILPPVLMVAPIRIISNVAFLLSIVTFIYCCLRSEEREIEQKSA